MRLLSPCRNPKRAFDRWTCPGDFGGSPPPPPIRNFVPDLRSCLSPPPSLIREVLSPTSFSLHSGDFGRSFEASSSTAEDRGRSERDLILDLLLSALLSGGNLNDFVLFNSRDRRSSPLLTQHPSARCTIARWTRTLVPPPSSSSSSEEACRTVEGIRRKNLAADLEEEEEVLMEP